MIHALGVPRPVYGGVALPAVGSTLTAPAAAALAVAAPEPTGRCFGSSRGTL